MTRQEPFWGELHTHTLLSDGNGSAEENFTLARSHLDFWAMADHAVDPNVFSAPYLRESNKPLLNQQWPVLQYLCRSSEQPGRFIPFLAYEWTNFQYGHHNVYYLDYDQPLRMPATLPELYRALEGVDAFVIPHHTAYPLGTCGKNWDFHDDTLSPFVEIYSLHGSSEEPGCIEPIVTAGSWMGPGAAGGSVQEALARGCRLGLMASSDGHAEHPGAYDCGLIAAYAPELTRPALWEAMRSRHIYAVTGDRIHLDFRLNDHPMGAVLPHTRDRHLDVSVVAWDRIDRVDVLRNNELLASFTEPAGFKPTHTASNRLRFMLEWGWDRNRDCEWESSLKITGGKILQAIPCFRGRVQYSIGRGIQVLSHDTCRWTSATPQYVWGFPVRRFAQIMALEVECTPDARLDFSFATGPHTRTWSMTPQELKQPSRLIYMADVPVTNDGSSWAAMDSLAKVVVHQGFWIDELTLDLSLHDHAADPGKTDYYYVRVFQHNAQRAWSSPVWIQGA